MPNIITPACELGYTEEQIKEMFTEEDVVKFKAWMYGQTYGVCEGMRYIHETDDIEESCGGVAHGAAYYPWDVNRFVLGKQP